MKKSEQDLIDALGINDDALVRLRTFERLLRQWSAVKNLVAPGAFSELWVRHILDSAQVQRTLPDARIWVDLGSGGGFPGVVTAILLSGRPGTKVHLVESDGRKCAFLRAVSRETGLSTVVHHARIESALSDIQAVDAVSARALAPMDQLIAWARPLIEKGATGVFLKGKALPSELTGLSADSSLQLETRPSATQPDGALVLVRHVI